MARQQAETREFRSVSFWRFPGVWTALIGGWIAMNAYTWTAYAYTIFVRLWMTEFKWPAALIGTFSTAARINGVWASPVGGWTVDNWGPRYATIPWMVLLAVGWWLIAYMTEPWQPLVLYGCFIAAGQAGGLYRISYTATNRWWMDQRTFWIGLLTMMGGVSAIIGLPITAFVIEAYGWRTAAIVAAIHTIVSTVPFALLYPNKFPESYGLYVDNRTPEQRRERAEREAARRGARVRVRPMLEDITVMQALRSFTFWMLVLSGGVAALGAAPLTIFQNARMGAVGYSPTAAALFYSLNRTMGYVGRFAITFFGDWIAARVPIRVSLCVIRIFTSIGHLCFAFGSNDLWFYAWAVIHAIPSSADAIYYPVLMGAYFGRQAYGTIYGVRLGITSGIAFLSPILVGWLADAYGWEWPFIVAAASTALGGFLLLLAAPPKEQAREA